MLSEICNSVGDRTPIYRALQGPHPHNISEASYLLASSIPNIANLNQGGEMVSVYTSPFA